MSSLYLQNTVGLKKLEFLGPNLPTTIRLTAMYSLGELIFPDNISEIYSMNSLLYSLYKLNIPKNVTSISGLSNCYNLVEIYNETGDNSILPTSLTQYTKNIYTPTSGESKLIYDGDFVYYKDSTDFDL
ncbi:MAG: hypothetical protein IKB96_07010, partial [Prevotella sp.]|nr:hypothetical protein [Prevotella sp.]